MPSLISVRSIVERIRSLSQVLTVSANMEGQFKLKAETDIVSVETFYRDLVNPELGGICVLCWGKLLINIIYFIFFAVL